MSFDKASRIDEVFTARERGTVILLDRAAYRYPDFSREYRVFPEICINVVTTRYVFAFGVDDRKTVRVDRKGDAAGYERIRYETDGFKSVAADKSRRPDPSYVDLNVVSVFPSGVRDF